MPDATLKGMINEEDLDDPNQRDEDMDDGINPSQGEDYDHVEEEQNMDDNRKPNQSKDTGMKLNQEEEHDMNPNQLKDDVNPNQGEDKDDMDYGINPSQGEDYDHVEEEQNMDDNRKPNQSKDTGMKLNQEEEHDVKHIQGDDNAANPNQELDYERGEDEEDMDDETTPDLPEDGNDHVTTMKPLATLQKHKAVREKANLAYRQTAERMQHKQSQQHKVRTFNVGESVVCIFLELIGQLQTCSIYPASLFRWLAKHTTCTVFTVRLRSLPNFIVYAIWSHSLVAIVYLSMTGRMILGYSREKLLKSRNHGMHLLETSATAVRVAVIAKKSLQEDRDKV